MYLKLWTSVTLLILVCVLSVQVWAQSPGDSAGVTTFDYQVGATPGNRIAVDRNGEVYVAWTDLSPQYTIRYNHRNLAGVWSDSNGISVAAGASPQIAIDSLNRPGIIFNSYQDVAYWTDRFGVIEIDSSYGCYGPKLTIDRNDNIHVFASSYLESGDPVQYIRSVNGGSIWSDPANIFFGFVYPTTPRVITSSPVSNKIAAVYPYPASVNNSIRYNIFYNQSVDGITWDWENGSSNITDYQGPLYASRDIDAVYDYNDNLHIIWTARNANDMAMSDTTYLFHYSVNTGISEITRYNIQWPSTGCGIGTGNRPLCRISIGASPSRPLLSVIYNWFTPDDCSASGFANGEIYYQYSTSGGTYWSSPVDLTLSHTPGCDSGNCDSDVGPSLAEKVDDYLHIFYIDDKDAGAYSYSEGVMTTNPMLYLRIRNPIIGIGDSQDSPSDFQLSQNYPNPFNASTNISFELQKDDLIKLEIYDITGAGVISLMQGRLQKGNHSYIWQADSFPSGIYFCRLTTSAGQKNIKMVLLK
jgi:hypothetical protein